MLDDVTQTVIDTINQQHGTNNSFYEPAGTPNYFASVVDIQHGQYLATTTDGVGSKVDHIIKHASNDIIGTDVFAMNINDLLCVGANPIGFQNHITTQRDQAYIIPDVISGILDACSQHFVLLTGGETEVLKDTKFHISGSAWGIIADGCPIIDGSEVEVGDVIIGLESNGLHANGWTALADRMPDYINETNILPTRLYGPDIHPLLTRVTPTAIVNITGGGFRNLERLPKLLSYDIKYENTQEIFDDISKKFFHREMYATFNMGIGMMVIVRPEDVEVAVEMMKSGRVIGKVVEPINIPEILVNGNPIF